MIIGRDGDIVLRELIEEDLLKLAEYANNEKISINLRDSFPYPYSLDDARHFFESVKNDNPPSTFAIEYQGNYVGNISLVRASDVYRNSAEIGYFIGEKGVKKAEKEAFLPLNCSLFQHKSNSKIDKRHQNPRIIFSCTYIHDDRPWWN